MSNVGKFDIVRSGYDVSQVNIELERQENEIKLLNEQIKKYQNQLEVLSNQFEVLKNRYQTLVSELEMRERAADNMSRLALQEANSVIENAQNNADDILNEAIFMAQSILTEVNQYNAESLKLKNQLKSQLEQYLTVLEKYDLPNDGNSIYFNSENKEIEG